MVNPGETLLHRPQKGQGGGRAPAGHAPVVRIEQTGQQSYCNDSDSSGERTRTPSPEPVTPIHRDASLEKITKALESLSLKNEVTQELAEGLPILEALACQYILNTFFVELGWNPQLGDSFTVDSLVADFKLDRHHQNLIGTLLTRLEGSKAGLLTRGPHEPGDGLLDYVWTLTALPPDATTIRQTLKELQTELVLEHPILQPELNFLNHVGRDLFACIRGRVDARELLFPSKDAPEYRYSLLPYYERATAVQEGQVSWLKEAVGQFVLGLAATAADIANGNENANLASSPSNEPDESETPLLRILEVGAYGSVAATAPLLRHLISVYNNNTSAFPPGALSRIIYTYTDSSSISLGKARQALEHEFPNIKFEFKALDLEAEPEEVESGSAQQQQQYNVVLGLNVIHTLKYLDDGLNALRKMLKPGGLLALGKFFGPASVFLECTLGVSEGWWKYADRERMGGLWGPLLNAKGWETILRRHDFPSSSAQQISKGSSFGIVLATG